MTHSPIRNMARCSLFTALICVCAWIAVPLPEMTFTMQTFGVFLALEILGGKWGSAACLVYLALGAVGLPVFSGFRGGPGVLMGATGGYVWGFLAAGLVYWAATARFGNRLTAMILGLLACYGCGTAWFFFAYTDASAGALAMVAVRCVVPYLLPDAAKVILAHRLASRLKRSIQ